MQMIWALRGISDHVRCRMFEVADSLSLEDLQGLADLSVKLIYDPTNVDLWTASVAELNRLEALAEEEEARPLDCPLDLSAL